MWRAHGRKVCDLTRGGLYRISRRYERVPKGEPMAEMPKGPEQKSALIVVPVTKRQGRVKLQKAEE